MVIWVSDLAVALQKQRRWFDSNYHLSKTIQIMRLYEKNPYEPQYIAHQGYHFVDSDGRNLGRILWINKIDGITVEEDET